jgi:hypothetical protein
MIARTQSKQYFLNRAIELGIYKTANFQHLLHDVVLRSEQLESGLTCMMCRKLKEDDGHTCCEECAGLAF